VYCRVLTVDITQLSVTVMGTVVSEPQTKGGMQKSEAQCVSAGSHQEGYLAHKNFKPKLLVNL